MMGNGLLNVDQIESKMVCPSSIQAQSILEKDNLNKADMHYL